MNRYFYLLSFLFVFCTTTVSAGESEFCLTKITPPFGNNCSGDDLSAAYFSWHTEADGTVSVTITGLPGNTATSFRNAYGMNATNLKVKGKAGISFTGTFADAGKTKIIYTPSAPLTTGDTLTYNGIVEYKTADVPSGGFALHDLWPTLSFTHTFGDVCVPPEPTALETPADIEIIDDSIITFTADVNAAYNLLTVYRSNSLLPVHIQNVNSGDTIHFSVAGSYTFTLQSITGDLLYLNSVVSAREEWIIAGEPPVVNVGETVFCNTSFGEGNAEALFTWETVNNQLVIKIAPVEIGDKNTKFRDVMNAANFTVNGFAGTWFEAGILNENNTVITYKPLIPLLDGDVVSYNAVVEYATKGNGNLYPTINFNNYIWGSRCPQAEILEAPTGINVNDGVLSFNEVDNAVSYKLNVYRKQSNLLEYEKIITSSPETLELEVPDNYTLTLRSIGNNVEYLSSEESPRYVFTQVNSNYVEPQAGVSTFCNFSFDPASNDHGDNDRIVFSWETINGNIVATISDAVGNSGTTFRLDGLFGKDLYVNGQSNAEWFTTQLIDNNTKVIFTPNIPLRNGDKIVYNGYVEYFTANTGEVGLWPPVNFGNYGVYLYGATCDKATSIIVSERQLFFTPDTGVRMFTVSGSNFTAPLLVTAPYGLTAQRAREFSAAAYRIDTLYPMPDGTLPATPVEIRWQEGSSEGGTVRIEGGGMPFAKEIPVVSSGFSSYCNKVLNFWSAGLGMCPVYLSVNQSASNVLEFILNPYYGTAARWAAGGNSIQADKVIVSNPSVVLTGREQSDNIITLTFSGDLLSGDTVKIGPNPAFVWEAQSEAGVLEPNCFIDAVQTYIAGKGCGLSVSAPAILPQVQDLNYQGQSFEGGNANITVQAGTYPVAKLRIWEKSGLVPFKEYPVNTNNVYQIAGLEPYNIYTFYVQAIDDAGYASLAKTFVVKNLGVLNASEVSFEDSVTFDGLTQKAQLKFPEGVGDSIYIYYNGAITEPTQVGNYVVSVSINEGMRYQAVENLLIGRMYIVRGSMLARMFEHSADTAVYNGLPHSASVSVRNDVLGAGSITAIKYNGSADVPVNAGVYAVSIDVSAGENYNATVDLPIDTLVILRAESTIELITYSTDTIATYNAEPHTIEVRALNSVVGLGNITLRYNGAEEAVHAGEYVITAVIEQGTNYNAASFILPVTLRINKCVLHSGHFHFPKMVAWNENGLTAV
ncbi:MAG: MBG domain-containing protein, partial [Bacteroidales bacterium]|nr:MBG domain-containing protein [Bacteroidales bacterium]